MKLHVLTAGPENGDTSLPPVVFIHGLFGRGRNFGFFQRRLAATRRTIAIDLRNHGASPHGRADYTVMAEDVFETLTALDALPAVIVGHSMGGKTSMMLALHHPEAVERLLVADIAPAEGSFAQSRSLAEDLAALHLPDSLNHSQADSLLATVIAEKPVRDLMMQNLELGDHPSWQIGLKEIEASMDDIISWPHIPQGTEYDGKVLFIRGGNSRYVQSAAFPEMKRLFPHYRLETIAGAGHWVHAEKPREFLELLEHFLAEQ
ncbi:alpha/beta fold hydrolase [Acetobacter sp. AN02]|uniref:alpha/beta fold hydrolase n=1 Tax=Acetobacter sp. AN02 TaxID=2894186 RepID=UPI00243428DA|nr:alpha/beta fold hydrolase [Acetobacter sp. AN02]MDG6095042.1 alpha/beta fold hydrolase [Acetobacter sp. AN02]